VRVGTGIASALVGRDGNGWLSYFLLWASFVAGAIGGALSYGPPPNLTLSAAAAGALVLAAVSLGLR
jgi:uncharacterized membrane protein YoaK (UPF0700 family)